MKAKVLVGILLFLIVVNLATLGTYLYLRFTAPVEPPLPLPEGRPPQAIMDLDPATRERLRGLMMEFRAEAAPLQQQILQAEDSIAFLLERDPLPADEIDLVFRRIAELRVSINKLAVQQLALTKSFLTPDQQRAFFHGILDARPQMRLGAGPGRGGRFGPDSGGGRPPGRGGQMRRGQLPPER